MLEVWLVRHGETNWNVERRIQGWADVPLNTQGFLQARLLAERLDSTAFTGLYASDLQRASATAEALAQSLGISVSLESSLRERRFGSAEGRLQREIDDTRVDYIVQKESDADLMHRAMNFLNSLQGSHDGRVLCVSHGGLIRMVLRRCGLRNIPPLQNTSISKLRWAEGQWTVGVINWVEHLSPLQCPLHPKIPHKELRAYPGKQVSERLASPDSRDLSVADS